MDSYLDSPLSGLAPWIVLSVLAGPGRFEAAIAVAFGFSLLTSWAGHRRGDRLHSLTVFGVAYFGVLLLVRVVAGAGTEDFLSSWTGEMSNIALAAIAASSLLIRKPFTLSYARETTPEEYWDTPVFLRTNYVISAVWAASFGFSALVGLLGIVLLHDADNLWTGWILQLGSTFFALAFTGTYPDYVGAKLDRDAGQVTGPPPSLLPSVDWIPMYVLIVGIIGMVIARSPPGSQSRSSRPARLAPLRCG